MLGLEARLGAASLGLIGAPERVLGFQSGAGLAKSVLTQGPEGALWQQVGVIVVSSGHHFLLRSSSFLPSQFEVLANG